MFRELVRKKQALSKEECISLLLRETRGVLSVTGDDGYPYGMPMNHFYNEEDGCLYFHCGRQRSHRTDALLRCDKVSFCVLGDQTREEGKWAWRVKSVIVFGKVEVIDDINVVKQIAEPLCRKFTADEAYIRHEIEHDAARTLILKLTPQHICGKQVTEE